MFRIPTRRHRTTSRIGTRVACLAATAGLFAAIAAGPTLSARDWPQWRGTDLIIAQFNPEGYVELDRTHLLNPTSRSGYGGSRAGTRSRYRHGRSDRLVVWAHPAFANRHVVLRNDEEIIRVSLDEADYR